VNIGQGKVIGVHPLVAVGLTEAICSYIVPSRCSCACGGIERCMPRAGRLLTVLKFTEKPAFAVNFV
jgi:hypothetical protein